MTLPAVLDGARLAALREVGVLDTDPEPEFDRFTRLTSSLLGTPVAVISLVDRHRQFFKSAVGLTGDWADARQTPLSHSLCQHVVAAGEALVVSDTRRVGGLSDNLAVRDLAAIAYAGVPLILEDGHAVGALCAIDSRPRQWTAADMDVLTDLGAAVQTLLDLRRELARRRLHDPLTGLPARGLIAAQADRLRAGLGDGDLLALAIGVDGMGAINEAHGAAHGDRVLTLIARRLDHQLQPTDLLGRLGGDAFVMLRPGVTEHREALELTDRVCRAVSAEPLAVRGEKLSVSATVGVATGDASPDGATLLARAEDALRFAKAQRGRVAVSERATSTRSAAHVRMRRALTGAVNRDELSVAFQPIVELDSGRPRGFEALARWHHPELGDVSPTEFVPVGELSGEIVAIGEYVLRTACRQLAEWRAEGGELEVTVNFSPVQLAVANIADVVASALADAGLPGSALALEITEGVFLSPGAIERRNLDRIRSLGVRIALDDFGTGYSALSYLKRLPVDLLKVDRSFLDGIQHSRRDAALMEAILSIGSGMQLEVVAEGIETCAQRDLLRRSGCQLGQGFLFARPLPAAEVALLAA